MAKAKIIHGKKKRKKYKHAGLHKLVRETLEAIGMTTVPGNWGPESCLVFFFRTARSTASCSRPTTLNGDP